MTFIRPAHFFYGKELVWFASRKGLRYRVELVQPPERDDFGRLLFRILEGPKQGEVLGLPQDQVTELRDVKAVKSWGGEVE